MGNIRLYKTVSNDSESHFLVKRNCVVLRLDPQGFEAGAGAFDVKYDGFHQSAAKIPASPCFEDGHAFDFCNARLVNAPASRSERGTIINTQYMAASIFVLIDFETDINVLFDFK